jgi:GcrA cell cycle regulator
MTKRLDPDRISSHHRGRDLFPDFKWNAEKTERLKRLWEEGLSDSRIAGLIGCSRNAVIGKRKRSGLQHPEDVERNARARATGNGGGTVVRVKAKRKRIASAHTGGTTQRINNRASGSDAPVEPRQISASLVEFNAAIPKDQIKMLVELGLEHCRWPMNDGGPYLFCGAVGANMGERRPYCSGHAVFAGRNYDKATEIGA